MSLLTADGIRFQTFEFGGTEATRAVLLLHDWWGIQDYNLEWARRFADLGYRALVVNLYEGQTADNAEQAGRLMRTVDQATADNKLLTAIEHLRPGQRRIATLGWSFGGRQALQAALIAPQQVSAAVLYYCRAVTSVSLLRRLRCPVLAFFAEREKAWPDNMVDFESAMTHAGKTLESGSYDAGHGFVNPSSERYDTDAADDAWGVTLGFLDRVLV